MVILVISNKTTSPIALQDPSGLSPFSITIPPSGFELVTVTQQQADSLSGILNRAKNSNFLDWTVDPTEAASIVYGSGQDGKVVFDGVTAYPFATLVGSVYTLNRDIWIADGSQCVTGVTVYTAGNKGFCAGEYINDGTLHNNGKNAVGGTAGAASALGTTGIGTAGGNGRANATGLAGSAQGNGLGDGTGAGGAGGSGGANAGGSGGTYTGTFANGGANYLSPMLSGYLQSQTSGGNQAQTQIIGGGAGGGGGGSDNAGVTGGGGGGGGGVLPWHCAIFVNNGVVECLGGNAANASGAGGNGGGGGGGGGGCILSLASARAGSGQYLVTGGNPGLGIGTGSAGTKGSDGHKNLFKFP